MLCEVRKSFSCLLPEFIKYNFMHIFDKSFDSGSFSLSVPMQDPRGNMQRGPPVGVPPAPRGLLGDAPNDPRGGTLLSVTGEVEPR